jgi:hypothetical protein
VEKPEERNSLQNVKLPFITVVERIDWKKQVKKLERDIRGILGSIPEAYWDDPQFIPTPNDREWGEAINAAAKSLPTPTEAIKILENRESAKYYDILKAELTVALVKKWKLEEAFMSPKELEEKKQNAKGQGWFIPEVE